MFFQKHFIITFRAEYVPIFFCRFDNGKFQSTVKKEKFQFAIYFKSKN